MLDERAFPSENAQKITETKWEGVRISRTYRSVSADQCQLMTTHNPKALGHAVSDLPDVVGQTKVGVIFMFVELLINLCYDKGF